MGYLHEGHLSLVQRAREEADRVVLSIFINPLQFGEGEDLERYPRDLDRDLELARSRVSISSSPRTRVRCIPTAEPWVAVDPERGADLLCGATRPGHFRGVLTVVAKLFGIVDPDHAVFGQKDLQQLTLIRRMVADLDMTVEIVAGPRRTRAGRPRAQLEERVPQRGGTAQRARAFARPDGLRRALRARRARRRPLPLGPPDGGRRRRRARICRGDRSFHAGG
jgi:pantoate--beta-alanine ligase